MATSFLQGASVLFYDFHTQPLGTSYKALLTFEKPVRVGLLQVFWIRGFTFSHGSSGVPWTWWDTGGIFAFPAAYSVSAWCRNREEHSPLAIHTAEFVHALVCLLRVLLFALGRVII